jgi:hypothetical protein
MCEFPEDIDCNECIHFYKDTIFCKRLGCSLISYNVDKGECENFTRKDDDLEVGDSVIIRKPDKPTELSISWSADMDWCDGYTAIIAGIESGSYILETVHGTVLKEFNRGPYLFHRNWLTKKEVKEMKKEMKKEVLYRVITMSLDELNCQKDLLNLKELIKYLNEEDIQGDCEALIFEINNKGPDKILDAEDWPVVLIEESYWKAR